MVTRTRDRDKTALAGAAGLACFLPEKSRIASERQML
jgi:hypothetical protein